MSLTAEQAHAPLSGEAIGLGTREKWLWSTSIGFCAVVWLMLLSGWLGVTPGSVLTQRQNVLFNSDTNFWVDRMIGDAKSPEQLVHPLELPLWRGPARVLYRSMQIFLPPEHARVIATRLLTALIAGIGVAFLAFLALQNGIQGAHFILLFIIYLLFTSNTTICLPEHFAISNGLLSIAFVVPFVVANPRLRSAILAALVILCGGTTITNAGFPVASLVHFSPQSTRRKIGAILLALPFAAAVCIFLFLRSWSIHWFVTRYLHLHGLMEPVRVFTYEFYALVAPAVGPTPRVLRWPGWDMVTYEPATESLHMRYYLGLQAIGAIAWIALLARCIYAGLQDKKTRNYVWLPLGWILFNGVFHNVWGDEMMLFAPHWSWALMGMVILGARCLSRKLIASFFFPIVTCQIYTLFMIKNELLTITR